MNSSSNGSSTWAGTGSPVTTQLWSSAARQPPLGPDDLARLGQGRHALRAGRAHGRPSRSATARRSASSATRSSRSPSRIWSSRSWMRETVGHCSLPCFELAPARSPEPLQNAFSASARVDQRVGRDAVPCTGYSRAASLQSALARASRAPQLRPTGQRCRRACGPSCRASDRQARAHDARISMTSMNRSVSATDAPIAALALLLEPDQHQCRDRCQHGEPAVERVGDGAFDIPVRLARFGGDRVEQRGAALRRRPLIRGTGNPA